MSVQVAKEEAETVAEEVAKRAARPMKRKAPDDVGGSSGDGGAAGSADLPREQRSSAKKARQFWMPDAEEPEEDNLKKHAEEEADEYEYEYEDSQ